MSISFLTIFNLSFKQIGAAMNSGCVPFIISLISYIIQIKTVEAFQIKAN